MTVPQASTRQALSAPALARFESELEEALRAHEARLQESPDFDDFSLAIRRRSEEASNEIEAALARLRDGSFGSCESCLTAISSERLEAMPHTRYCPGCATTGGGGRHRGESPQSRGGTPPS